MLLRRPIFRLGYLNVRRSRTWGYISRFKSGRKSADGKELFVLFYHHSGGRRGDLPPDRGQRRGIIEHNFVTLKTHTQLHQKRIDIDR